VVQGARAVEHGVGEASAVRPSLRSELLPRTTVYSTSYNNVPHYSTGRPHACRRYPLEVDSITAGAARSTSLPCSAVSVAPFSSSVSVPRPLDNPDVVLAVHGHPCGLGPEPAVGQWLRPEGIHLERGGARRLRADQGPRSARRDDGDSELTIARSDVAW